jgi:TetR/AcrR family fatty acid metabolism transcriptional regulator
MLEPTPPGTDHEKNRNLPRSSRSNSADQQTIKDYRNNKFSEYTDLVADIIRLGQKQGIYREDIEPNIAKRFFFGALDEVSRIWNTTPDGHFSVDVIAEQLLKIFLSGILIPADTTG